jgi:hypothetical protein
MFLIAPQFQPASSPDVVLGYRLQSRAGWHGLILMSDANRAWLSLENKTLTCGCGARSEGLEPPAWATGPGMASTGWAW